MKPILIIFFILFIIPLQSQEFNLNKNSNDKDVQKWENFIKNNPATPKTFNILNKLASVLHQKNKTARAYYLLEKNKLKFSVWGNTIRKLIKFYSQVMLTQFVTHKTMLYYREYIRNYAPTEDAFVALKRVSEIYTNKFAWDSAMAVYNNHIEYFPFKKIFILETIDILHTNSEKPILKNLSTNINTIYDEWDPNPSPDGKYLFFSSSRPQGSFGQADVWYSEFGVDGWGKAENIGSTINGINKETVDNVTVDGNSLMLSGDFEGTFGNFDIYSTRRQDSSWSSLHHFPMPINSEYTDEGAYLTSDGNALFFTSDRPQGTPPFVPFGTRYHGNAMGNMDIYVSQKDSNGKWGQAINLGQRINTPYAERSPYLHPDGKTLYFSSDGHPGLGGLDVYKSTRLSDTLWTKWSKPLNLGKYINTISNDWGYKIGTTGDSALFAAQNRTIGYGGWDLFSVSLPDKMKPERVFTISGTVKDKQGKALSADIKWEDLSTKKILGTSVSNPLTGNYFIVLPMGKHYGYFAEKNGFYPISNNFDLRNIKARDHIQVDITLTSIDAMLKGNSIIINNIFFDTDKAELKDKSFAELDRLAKFLKKYTNKVIEISGYTDNTGTIGYSMQLSKQRARAVAEYLIAQGFDKNRLLSKGYGNAKPISNNNTDEGRAKNRRVEVRFVE